jgi:hypothetical protein
MAKKASKRTKMKKPEAPSPAGTYPGSLPPPIGHQDVKKAFDALQPQDTETKLRIIELLYGGQRRGR